MITARQYLHGELLGDVTVSGDEGLGKLVGYLDTQGPYIGEVEFTRGDRGEETVKFISRDGNEIAVFLSNESSTSPEVRGLKLVASWFAEAHNLGFEQV